MTAQSGLGFSGIVAIQIPDDGAIGTVLTKLSAGNYDYDWEDPAGGFVGLGIWRYRTEIVAPPGSGQVRFNNATIESATIMWINETNDGGTDVSVFLDSLTVGSLIFLQDQTNAENFVLVEIATVTDEGTYREITIEEVEAQGAAFTQNLRIAVIISGGGGGGGGLSGQLQWRNSVPTVSLVQSDFTIGSSIAEGVQAVSAGAGAGLFTPTAIFTDHPGIWGMRTGTTATGRVFIIGRPASFHVGVGGITRVGTWVRTPATLSDAVQEYVLRAGFFSIALPNTINEGIGFEYQFDQNGGRWQGITDATAESSLDTGITVVVDTFYYLEFEVNAAGTSVEFFIDGVSVGTLAVAANIPAGTGFDLFYNTHIMKLVGTTARDFFIDAYYTYQEISR